MRNGTTLSNRVAIQQEFTKLNHRIQDLKFSMVIDDLIHQANEGSVQHLVSHTLPFYLCSTVGGIDTDEIRNDFRNRRERSHVFMAPVST